LPRLPVPRRGDRLRRRHRRAARPGGVGVIHGWTAAQVRAAEEPLLAAGVPLMERAATGLAHRVARLLRERRGRVTGSSAVLLVGSGDNGGDTLHAGALLARRGVRVRALLTSA